MESITSPNNPKVKLAAHLREARQRKKLGLTLIDGERELRYALQSRTVLESVFVSEGSLENPLPSYNELIHLLSQSSVVYRLPDELHSKISFGERGSGIVGIAKPNPTGLDRLQVKPQPLILVLDQIEKPGNLGAILRTADASGVDAVLLSDPSCELFNPNAIRASQGSIFTVKLATGSFDQVWNWLQEKQLNIFAARVDGSRLYNEFDFRSGAAIVLGSEATGLGNQWNRKEVVPIRLPMLGTMDSLNVSVTAGVLAYEAWRQRQT